MKKKNVHSVPQEIHIPETAFTPATTTSLRNDQVFLSKLPGPVLLDSCVLWLGNYRRSILMRPPELHRRRTGEKGHHADATSTATSVGGRRTGK